MKKFIFIISSFLLMTSCSTLVNGKAQAFNIKSNNNQKIFVKDTNGNILNEGKGELDIILPKSTSAFTGATYFVEAGNKKVTINPRLNIGAFLVGNLFVPGFWGYLVDGVTGAMYDLEVDGVKTNIIELE